MCLMLLQQEDSLFHRLLHSRALAVADKLFVLPVQNLILETKRCLPQEDAAAVIGNSKALGCDGDRRRRVEGALVLSYEAIHTA